MDEEQAHHLELVQAEEEMALADVSAQVLRCSAYESVIRAAAADEEQCKACTIHMLGAAFARFVLHLAQTRLAHARAATHSARAAAAISSDSFRQIAMETKNNKVARAHAEQRLAAATFGGWRAVARRKRARSARTREGVLFQSYLQHFAGGSTRLFMQREGRVAMGAGTGAGAGALLWMIAARHAWLRASRIAFAALRAHWAENMAVHRGYESGARELFLRAFAGWAAVVQRLRVVKVKSEEAHRMRARRLLALARGTLVDWRRKLAAAHKMRLRLQGLRLRRETSEVGQRRCEIEAANATHTRG